MAQTRGCKILLNNSDADSAWFMPRLMTQAQDPLAREG